MQDSIEVAPLAATRKGRAVFFWPRANGWILLLLLVWLYHSTLYRLVMQWLKDPNFQHGVFVPAFALFVLWQDRRRLKTVPNSPSWTGLPVVVFGLLMLTLGDLGVELFTERASLLVLLAGLIVLFRGWPMFRAVLFPWAFSFLMIPLPALVLQHFSFPLQILAAKLSTWCLQAIGVPVLREGNVINLAHTSLDVVQACSGIRFLLSLVTLAIIYGYLMENRNWARVLLACFAVPIAVIANAFRIFVAGLIAQFWSPDKAQGFFHEFQGWLVFVVALALFFTVHRVINLWKPVPPDKRITPAASPVSAAQPESAPAQIWSWRFGITVALMLVVAIVQARSQEELSPPPDLDSIPEQFDNWKAVDEPIDEDTREILGQGEFLARNYLDVNDRMPSVNLFVAYYPTQRFGETPHSPSHCLPGAGWIPTRREVIDLARPDGSSFPVNRYVISMAGERQLVIYWFQAHGREVASEYSAKYYLIADSIRLHRSDSALIRLMTPMQKGESADAAQARLMQLGSRFLPFLDRSVPR